MTVPRVLILLAFGLAPIAAGAFSHGDRLAQLPADIARILAERNLPSGNGALGRNRKAYFHVRFQMGVHQLANHAISAKDPRSLELFVEAVEYALTHQRDDGRFEVIVPPELASEGAPSPTDLASGVAFFLSSAGTGLDAIRSSTWVHESASLQPIRKRCDEIVNALRATLEAMLEDEPLLLAGDRQAPNRLLFNAAAFLSLGRLLNDTEATEAGERFLNLAKELIHEDGYFIEGGGSDTSYNGVAAAIALRIALMIDSEELKNAGLRAVDWQVGRISPEGEISTAGNTRVRPGGEKFLNHEKGVDVGHTLEALAFASMIENDPTKSALARSIYDFYRKR